jgi:hypothetical protein
MYSRMNKLQLVYPMKISPPTLLQRALLIDAPEIRPSKTHQKHPSVPECTRLYHVPWCGLAILSALTLRGCVAQHRPIKKETGVEFSPVGEKFIATLWRRSSLLLA